jgi:glutamate/tyrosine decarboxylase-like PLP-dependent enzyme
MDPLTDDTAPALDRVHRFALDHLERLGELRAATDPRPREPLPLAASGTGALAAIEELLARYGTEFSGSPGPRYWGFINGGVTPAALAGDWLASAIDQNSQLNGDGAAAFIDHEALVMLRELFRLPGAFHGVFVTGGTMANHVGLGIALQRLGTRRGVDVSRSGVAALSPVRIVTGEAHSSIAKSAAMLGLGRDSVVEVARLDGREAVDPEAMERVLGSLAAEGANLIVVANAGTVLTGDFDDIDALADLAERYGAHLHVDGAFGAFAACSAACRHLVEGMARADTVASDGHKFLNVPFDCGFLFARSLGDQVELFKNVSSYQSPPRLDPRHYIHLSPQNSRRLRGLPAWVSLRAYGAEGHAAIVDRCCRLAAELGRRIDASDEFRLLAPVRYTVVCFQLLSGGHPADEAETAAFLERVRDDGRVFVTPGNLRGTPCVRLAMVNWRTTETDIDIAMEAFRDCRG